MPASGTARHRPSARDRRPSPRRTRTTPASKPARRSRDHSPQCPLSGEGAGSRHGQGRDRRVCRVRRERARQQDAHRVAAEDDPAKVARLFEFTGQSAQQAHGTPDAVRKSGTACGWSAEHSDPLPQYATARLKQPAPLRFLLAPVGTGARRRSVTGWRAIIIGGLGGECSLPGQRARIGHCRRVTVRQAGGAGDGAAATARRSGAAGGP